MPLQFPAYESAQTYYQALRKKFLSQAALQRTETMEQAFQQLVSKEIANDRKQYFAQVAEGVKLADTKIVKHFKKEVKNWIQSNSNIQTMLSNLKQLEADLQNGNNDKTIAEQIKKTRQSIISQVTSYIMSMQTIDIEAELKNFIKTQIGTDSNILLTNYINYCTRKIIKDMNILQSIFIINRASMAGYYKEFGEAKIISEFGAEFGLKATQMGQERSVAANYVDIVIGKNINNKKAIANITERTTSLLEKIQKCSFNKSIEITKPIEISEWDQILNAYENMTVGIQSKLYSISFDKPRPQGYSIGHRATLLQAFETWQQNQKRYHILRQQIERFFAEYHTVIIEAFGPTTLIFSTGDQRYFIDDLIESVKHSNLRFMFNINRVGMPTPLVKMEEYNENEK